ERMHQENSAMTAPTTTATGIARPGRILGWIAMCLLVPLLMVGCGKSRVVREAGSPTRASVPKPGATTIVQRGDTLYRIAVNNGISPMDLALWNGISAPYTIHPGQRLRLYPQSGGATAASTSTPRAPARPTTAPRASTAAVRPTQAPPQATPSAPASSPFSWRWPTDGQLVGRYVAGDPTKQ